jgi:hypothetical protein
MLVDTGNVRVYLPAVSEEQLLQKTSLSQKYTKVHYATSHEFASEDAESGWLTAGAHSTTPVFLEFVGLTAKWPVSLDSPLGDESASIRGAAQGGRAILGMPFISKLKGIIFDFTEGKPRIGFISWDDIVIEENLGERPKDRVLQFMVGTALGIGVVCVWRWYEG